LIALPDFDQVAVWVAEVAAGFLPAVDWGCEEVGASLAPGLVDRLDVGDADVQEAAHAIGILWRLENDARLVVCGSAADVDDDPAVRERDDRRLAGENDLAAENVAVKRAARSTSSATMKWVSVIPSLSVGRLAMVVFLLGDRQSFGLEGEGEACSGVCCGVGWE
jgi:hypothetical protein